MTSTYESNAYTIQANSERYTNSSLPSGAYYWQQFYFQNQPASSQGVVGMEYWLINYGSTCPSTHSSYTGAWTHPFVGSKDCYADTTPQATAQDNPGGLASYLLQGCVSCVTSGDDTAEFCDVSTCDYNTAPDSILHLGSNWISVELNIFGYCCADRAYFTGTGSSGTDIAAQVYLWDSSGNTYNPSASSTTSTTGGSNNLNLYSWGHSTGSFTLTECNTTPC